MELEEKKKIINKIFDKTNVQKLMHYYNDELDEDSIDIKKQLIREVYKICVLVHLEILSYNVDRAMNYEKEVVDIFLNEDLKSIANDIGHHPIDVSKITDTNLKNIVISLSIMGHMREERSMYSETFIENDPTMIDSLMIELNSSCIESIIQNYSMTNDIDDETMLDLMSNKFEYCDKNFVY